jgi:predicted GIY-YIG superfamily endonuclease
MEQGGKHIVYQIQGEAEAVLYVGITGRKSRRLRREHFTPKGHVDAACYREARAIFYHECISREDASFREAYLIKTLNPRFNEKLKKPGAFSFSISFDWQYLPVDKSRLDTPTSPRRRRKNAGLQIPTFDEAKLSLGTQLSFDCAPARIEGPVPGLTWLDGEKLGRIMDEAWTESGAPGPLYVGGSTSFVCAVLSDQDWVCHIKYLRGADTDDVQMTRPCVTTRGELGNRVSLLSARGEAEVLHELSRSAQSWYRETGPRRLVGTLATNLDHTVRVYNWRDKYFLSLVHLWEILLAGTVVEDRYVVLTCDLQRGPLHDWFVDQSRAVGYNVWISGVAVQPGQKKPTTVWDSGRRRVEAECLWHEQVFPAGRSVALLLNQTVWVYSFCGRPRGSACTGS